MWKNKIKKLIDPNNIPKHIAIIMDGNGRWAKRRGLPRYLGHRKGIEALGATIQNARKMGIKVLTVFAFSTENWDRPKTEVEFIMSEIKRVFQERKSSIREEGIRIRVIGEKSKLSDDLLTIIDQVQEETKAYDDFTLVIAFNYGSRQEILNVTQRIAKEVKEGILSLDQIDMNTIDKMLYTNELPPLDLLIRTSGEKRISNFLLWQLAYSEIYFTKVYWPDFREKELYLAVIDFQQRHRRFGAIGEE